MTVNAKVARSSFTRVFAQEGDSAPNLIPQYYGLARAGAPSWPQGDVTPVRVPSDKRYDDFDVIDTIRGAQGLPSLPIEFRKELGFSRALQLTQQGCPLSLQIHFGQCKDPRDANAGWSDGHIEVIPGASITDYSATDLGALDSDQRASLMETLNFTGERIYQIKPLSPSQKAAATVTDEVIDVAICDSVTCGNCGLPSDGAQIQFALVTDSSGSPGLPAKVIYTSDAWANVGSSSISSLGLAEAPDAFACMGQYLVVVSNASQSHHYVKIEDLLAGTGTWTEVTTNYNASGPPNDLTVSHPNLAYVVGDGGYVYRLTDPTAAPEVVSSGDVTTENLQGAHSFGDDFGIAVGANNALIVTFNGGDNWTTVTGPIAAVTLNAVFAHTESLWWIAAANGNIYYSLDQGVNWTVKAFQGSTAGNVEDIVFVTREVGYIAHTDTANTTGYVLRTIDGGQSWYRLPEGSLVWPSYRESNALAVADAKGSENVLLVGGLATDANDGILILAT
jgi:photosystem II stability/assembly factor-like uncharacterized protein